MSIGFEKIRVRFAPSPTGFLHVGGARTAIFNWLFAHKTGGKFLLRIEDTDVQRSGLDEVDAIIQGLQWLGLDWDEEIIYQSQRLQIYRKYIDELLLSGKAYKCFCSKDEIERQRQKAADEKRDFRYRQNRTCLKRSNEEIVAFEREGRLFAVRFKLPEGETVFTDHVYGEIKVDHQQLDDFIILRSDGYPTYHFAVVIDDSEMGISHIIRGDDHLSNTPKHILLYEALGKQPPVFVHVPLILGPDKQRLSKRHGATAVGEYEKAGYLPETVCNFLSLLGWSSGDDREIFSREELIREFSLEGISKKSAVFDEQKLEWMNGQYIMALSDERLLELVQPRLIAAGLLTQADIEKDKERILKILALLKPRLKRLSEVPEICSYFFEKPQAYDEKGMRKHWRAADVEEKLERLRTAFGKVTDFTTAGLEPVLRELCEGLDLSAAKLIHPLRLALTGRTFSPGIFEVMALLGKEVVLERIAAAIEFIQKNPVEVNALT